MFVSNISFKDYIGIIHQSMVLLMTIPFEKRMILIIRITLGVYASLMLLGEVFAGNMFDRLSTILSFIFFLIFVFSPASVLTILGIFLYGCPGYSSRQILFLSSPNIKKLAKLRAQYNIEKVIKLDFPQILRLRVPFLKPQRHLVLTHRPTKRQLRKLKKKYPNAKISYVHSYPRKKKAAAYSMAFTYKHYLVFFKSIPFSKQPYSIIDLSNESNAKLWGDIKSNKRYYQRLVSDNVRFHVNASL